MLLKHNLRWEILVYKLLTVQFEKIHNWHYWKYININIFNNVNLINNTYKYFFFKLLLRIFDVVWQLSPSTMQHELSNQDKRGNVNYNGSKLIDRWNVNKLTAAWTKMEVGKLGTRVAQLLEVRPTRSRCHHKTKWSECKEDQSWFCNRFMKYVICNMFVLISC